MKRALQPCWFGTVPPWFPIAIHVSVKNQLLVWSIRPDLFQLRQWRREVNCVSLGGKTLFIFFQEVLDSSVLNKQKNTTIFPAHNYKTWRSMRHGKHVTWNANISQRAQHYKFGTLTGCKTSRRIHIHRTYPSNRTAGSEILHYIH